MNDILAKIEALLPKMVDSLVYIAIALVTLVGIVKCIMPVFRTGSALKRGVRRLENRAGQEFPVWKDPRFLGKRLQNSWQRFLYNAEQMTFRGLSLNTDEYINDDTVIYLPGNGAFADMIPSLLTSLGILGTFIGLMNGLSGLDFTNADKLIDAIPTLLEGMRYAFATSVAGISCSLAFNMVYRIVCGRSYNALDEFSDAFAQLALFRAPDDTVQIICQNQDRNVLMHNVAEDISVRMASGVENAITRAMIPVTQSMDSFIKGATREQMDGIGRIVTHFIVKMNESLSGQFLELGRTMTELNRQQAVSNETLRESLTAAGSMVEDLRALHLTNNAVLDRFEDYAKALAKRAEDDTAFQQKAQELLAKMHQSQEGQTSAIASLHDYQSRIETSLREYTTWSDRILTGVKQQGENAQRMQDDAGENFKTASRLLSDSYATFVENITEGLSRSLGMFEENMHDVLTMLSERLEALENVSGGDGGQKAQLEAYNKLQQTVQDIKTAVAHGMTEGA